MKHSPVYFKDGFKMLEDLTEKVKPSLIIVLADKNTNQYCYNEFIESFGKRPQLWFYNISPGEKNKSVATFTGLLENLSKIEADRNTLLLNLGGGVVTDLGGFAASVYKRGIQFVNIPTSLLGMVDAAIGGKTGINLNEYKNLIGTFNFPLFTIIHPSFLKSLPIREFNSGLAEILKHGLVYSKNHWEKFKATPSFDTENVEELIYESVQIKLEIIEKDPYEEGLRKILNFGHTIGHAAESEFILSEKPILHGEAVAIGILVETVLSYQNELIAESELNEIFCTVISHFGKTELEQNRFSNLFKWMANDKKNNDGKINFSLLQGIGKAKYDVKLTKDQVLEGLKNYNQILNNF